MKILGLCAHPVLPEYRTGLQWCIHTLLKNLAQRGHEVALSAGTAGSGRYGFVYRLKLKLAKKPYTQDLSMGYPVFRSWFPWQTIGAVDREFNPDVIIVFNSTTTELIRSARQTKKPCLISFHDVDYDYMKGDLSILKEALPCIANSEFTKKRHEDLFGLKPGTIYPVIDLSEYRTRQSSAGQFVTFINLHPHKRVEIALELAKRCSDMKFLFVEGWTLNKVYKKDIYKRIRATPNITLMKSNMDMRKVYKHTKILLVPSQCEEAFGRVVVEAQCNGIPVIASDIGGLSEAVGPGGLLVAPKAPIEEWEKALRSLWDNKALYEEKSMAALDYAARPALNLEAQISAWEEKINSIL